jgi:hypothetical protein
VYEQFRFVVTDDSQARNDYFLRLANRVTELLGGQSDGMVPSAATLCATAAIPAMKTLFEECTANPVEARRATASSRSSAAGIGSEIKLVSVMSRIHGDEIETQWGMHPRFLQDLANEEAMELTRLMNEVTKVLGGRYAEVAFSPDWSASQQRGHA